MPPISDATFTNLSQAIKGLQLPDISRTQAEQLVEFVGVQKLQGLFAAAKSGDTEAKVKIHQVVLSLKALYYLLENGFRQVTLQLIAVIVDKFGYPKLRPMMIQAVDGDANARAVINEWLERAANGTLGLDKEGPIESDGDPLHPTDVEPPGDQVPMRAGEQRAAQQQRPQPAPHGQQGSQRPAAQAYRSQPGAPARTPSQAGTNVRQFPQNAGDHDDDDADDREETSARFAPTNTSQQTHSQGQGGAQSDRKYDQHSCYGKDVAIQFERTPNQRKTCNTVNLKIAKAKFPGKTCKEGVEWNNGSIIIALEPHEVQLVYAVMMGFGPKFRAAGHGADNQKWFEVEETSGEYAGSVRVTVGHGRNDIRKVNISFTDLKEVMELFSRTLQDQGKGQSPVFMFAEVRRVYDLYAKKAALQENRQGGGQQRQQARGS